MFDQFLTIDELDANTQALKADPRATIRPLGVSRSGRPIEMISVGEGDRQALIVGAPHPNEPVGTLTVERMIDLLLNDPGQRRGYRWNFIKAIDPEGVRLNGGWLKKPRTLTNYLENFFRPALDRQPETTFPIDAGGLKFDRATPENQAWQKALALTRPALHASLHHCDYGGCFYSLSRALPPVVDGLEGAIVAAGLTVHETADGALDAERWSPAVKRYPSAPEMTAAAKALGETWAADWPYGEMSPGYGEAHYGTFTLIAEMPMWDSPALRDPSPSSVTRSEHHATFKEISGAATALAHEHTPALAACDLSADAKEFLWSIQGSLKMMPAPDASAQTPIFASDDVLSWRAFEMEHTRPALFALRTTGMVLRLAELVLADDPQNAAALRAQHDARSALRRGLASVEARSKLTPIPLDVLTEFQMRSIFLCADALAGTNP